jgi:hypothetical protein
MSIMAKERPPRSATGRTSSGANKPAQRTEQPFDRWLRKQLHEMSEAIAREPLPDDLLRLIDNDAKAGP